MRTALFAVKHIGAIGKGRTNPQLFQCADGHIYVVKLKFPQFARTVPNEWLAYLLGRTIDLPMPFTSLIDIPQALIRKSPELNKMEVTSGPHVGSLFQEAALRTINNLRRCYNINKLADMFVFDSWINNQDRNIRNVLVVNDKKPTLLFIDHEKAFCGRNWQADDLQKQAQKIKPKWDGKQEKLLMFVKSGEQFERPLQNIQSVTASTSILEYIITNLPLKWKITNTEKISLLHFLDQRKARLEESIEYIKGGMKE